MLRRSLTFVGGAALGVAVLPPVVLLTAKDQPLLSTGAVRVLGSTVLPLVLGAHLDVDEMRGTLQDFSIKGLKFRWSADGLVNKRKFDGFVEADAVRVRLCDADWSALRRSPVAFVKSVLAFEDGAPQHVLRVELLEVSDCVAVVRFREPSPTPPPNVVVERLSLSRVAVNAADWTRRKSPDPIELPGVGVRAAHVTELTLRKPIGAALLRSSVSAFVGDSGLLEVEPGHMRLVRMPLAFVRAYAPPALQEIDSAEVTLSLELARRDELRGWHATGALALTQVSTTSQDAWKQALVRQFDSLSGKPFVFRFPLDDDVDADVAAERFVLRLGLAVVAETVVRNKDAIVSHASKAWNFVKSSLQ
jgi:hypothetical protein